MRMTKTQVDKLADRKAKTELDCTEYGREASCRCNSDNDRHRCGGDGPVYVSSPADLYPY